MICVGALLNCEEYTIEFFSKNGHTISQLEKKIVTWLKDTFLNSIAELKGIEVNNCAIKVDVNMEDIGVNRMIGMILYSFVAAGLIALEKMDDYPTSKKVVFSRKMLIIDGKENMYFYHKYEQFIDKMVERKIIV